jgi:hypothetical protein
MPIKYTTTQWDIRKILLWRSKAKLRIPRHQRGSAWNHDHETSLIDTIYRGLPISSITLSSVDLSGNNVHFIEDGKQRLNTLEKFFANKIDLDGAYFISLPKEVQEEFLNYKVPVLIYSNATEEERIEIFDRLQNGILLSYGERFHAIRFLSPMVSFACEVLLNTTAELQPKIEKVWGRRFLQDESESNVGDGTKRYRVMREAVCIVSGCLWGTKYYSENYDILREKLRKPLSEEQKNKAVRLLSKLIEIYELAIDSIFPNHEIALKNKKLTDSFWAPKNFSGFILYSLWDFPTKWDALTTKWVAFLIKYRLRTTLLKEKLLEPSKGMPMDLKHKAGWLAMNDDPTRILQRADESEEEDDEQ